MIKILSIITIALLVGILGIRESFSWKKDAPSMISLKANNSLQQYGVEVISSADPNFNVELTQYIRGQEQLIPIIDSVKPFAVFIKNNTQKDIVGMSLNWKFIKNNGETETVPQIETALGELMRHKPIDPWMIGKMSLLSANSTRFFSVGNPYVQQDIVNTNLRIKYQKSQPIKNPEEIQRIASAVGNERNQTLNKINDVSVSIDGIIFDDGTFVGADQTFYFEYINGILQARKDFLGRLREAKQANRNLSEILTQFVAEIPETPASDSSSQPRTGYANSEDAFKQSYASYLNALRKEISFRRTKFSDEDIVGTYLEDQESNFIMLNKK